MWTYFLVRTCVSRYLSAAMVTWKQPTLTFISIRRNQANKWRKMTPSIPSNWYLSTCYDSCYVSFAIDILRHWILMTARENILIEVKARKNIKIINFFLVLLLGSARMFPLITNKIEKWGKLTDDFYSVFCFIHIQWICKCARWVWTTT